MAAFLYLFSILFLLMPHAAMAAGQKPLIFASVSNDLRVREAADFVISSGALPAGPQIDHSPIDLNGDGVNEIIFRQSNPTCEASSDCPYVVTGISNRAPAILTTFRARKIGISGEKSYGVLKIMVYNQKQNDFQYITLSWDPYSSSFKPQ